MISPQNVLRHELIGLDVLVVRASNPGHAGVSGRVTDETRNTLVILTGRGEKQIPKQPEPEHKGDSCADHFLFSAADENSMTLHTTPLNLV